jgi:3-phosphoshikimate 1-carboxyvinyltransferase
MLAGFKYSGCLYEHPAMVDGGGSLSACDVIVPGDLSSAAFFLVGATISEGSSVRLENIGVNRTRSGILEILERMGADIRLESNRMICGEEVADLVVRYSPLHGISIGPELVSRSIDEFPAIAIAAACAKGSTTIRGAEELRVKETDRIKAIVKGLRALGIQVVELEDGMVITGGELYGGEVNSCQDHRIAMAFSVAGAATKGNVQIEDCDNVETSFPNFVSEAAGSGLNIVERPGEFG